MAAERLDRLPVGQEAAQDRVVRAPAKPLRSEGLVERAHDLAAVREWVLPALRRDVVEAAQLDVDVRLTGRGEDLGQLPRLGDPRAGHVVAEERHAREARRELLQDRLQVGRQRQAGDLAALGRDLEEGQPLGREEPGAVVLALDVVSEALEPVAVDRGAQAVGRAGRVVLGHPLAVDVGDLVEPVREALDAACWMLDAKLGCGTQKGKMV